MKKFSVNLLKISLLLVLGLCMFGMIHEVEAGSTLMLKPSGALWDGKEKQGIVGLDIGNDNKYTIQDVSNRLTTKELRC